MAEPETRRPTAPYAVVLIPYYVFDIANVPASAPMKFALRIPKVIEPDAALFQHTSYTPIYRVMTVAFPVHHFAAVNAAALAEGLVLEKGVPTLPVVPEPGGPKADKPICCRDATSLILGNLRGCGWLAFRLTDARPPRTVRWRAKAADVGEAPLGEPAGAPPPSDLAGPPPAALPAPRPRPAQAASAAR